MCLGRPLLRFSRLPSTSTTAAGFGRRGWPEGLAVWADEQYAGRGRLGRSWYSPRGGGVWLSVLLRPPLAAPELPRLSLAAGLAVARAIFRVTGLGCGLKWPNDVTLAGRKLAGILAEAHGAGRGLEFVVLGVGVNVTVNEWPPELRSVATSLAAAGRCVPAAGLVPAVLEELERDYFRLLAGHWEELRAEWKAAAVMMGRLVAARGPAGEVIGTAHDLGPSGELVLELEDGSLQAFAAGEVSLRPPGKG